MIWLLLALVVWVVGSVLLAPALGRWLGRGGGRS